MATINQNYLPKADATNPNLANFNQTNIYEDVNQNVGIGTTSPLSKLHNNGELITKGPWYDVRAYGATPLQLRGSAWGTNGTIVASTNRITESGKFTDAVVGDSLWINDGANFGRYTITSKINNDTVEVSDFPYDQSAVYWQVTQGVVDNTTAFQNAINDAAASVGGMQSSGVVYVPKGKYRITAGLQLSQWISLIGAGVDATVIIADFQEKTGTGDFYNDSTSVTNVTGSLAANDYVKVQTHDFTALAKVSSIASGTATLHVRYYGANASGATYKTVSPAIEINSTNDVSVKDLTIVSAQDKDHIGINVFHSGRIKIEKVLIDRMYVGITLSNAINDVQNTCVRRCKTGIHFGNPGLDSAGTDRPDWGNMNTVYGGNIVDCTEYGVRFAFGWSNVLHGVDISCNTTSVAGISFEGGAQSVGGNSLFGCFIETNSTRQVYIQSQHNRIMSCHFGPYSPAAMIEWGSGYDASSSGNIIFGNWFAGSGEYKEIMLSNLGIGTPSPADKLDTKGNIRTTPTGGNDSYPTTQLLNYSHDNVSLNFDSWWDSSWKSSDGGSNFRIYKIGDKLRISYASGVTAGNTINAWASENDNCALVVDSEGAVGIGTTSPAAGTKLDVNGNIKASGSVQVGNNTDGASESLVGAIRYRTSGTNSYVDVCMQTSIWGYSWVNLKTMSW